MPAPEPLCALDPADLSPGQRRHQLARLFAAAVLRLRARPPVSPVQEPAESSRNCLELARDTPLSVKAG